MFKILTKLCYSYSKAEKMSKKTGEKYEDIMRYIRVKISRGKGNIVVSQGFTVIEAKHKCPNA